MASFPWSIGGGSLSYTIDKSTITFTSTPNEGVDRSMKLYVKGVNVDVKEVITINQVGKREYFYSSQGDIFQGSDEEYLTLK